MQTNTARGKNGKSCGQTDERQRQRASSEISIMMRRGSFPEMKLPQGKAEDPGPHCQQIVSEKFQLVQFPVTNRRRQLGRSIISKTIPSPVTIRRRQFGRYIIVLPNSSPVGTNKCPSNSKTSHNQPVGTTMCPSIRNGGVCVCQDRRVGFLPKART